MKSVLVVFFVELALVTMAQALVIMVRGIDLSVGGVIALTVISVGFFHKTQHLDIWTRHRALGLLVGTGCGLLNGLFITQLRTPPIIATLGSGIMFQGISLGISGGKPYSVFPARVPVDRPGLSGPLPGPGRHTHRHRHHRPARSWRIHAGAAGSTLLAATRSPRGSPAFRSSARCWSSTRCSGFLCAVAADRHERAFQLGQVDVRRRLSS